MIRKDSFEIDGKSILGVLSLAAIYGTEVAVTIAGEDSELAMEEVSRLIENGFGEENRSGELSLRDFANRMRSIPVFKGKTQLRP